MSADPFALDQPAYSPEQAQQDVLADDVRPPAPVATPAPAAAAPLPRQAAAQQPASAGQRAERERSRSVAMGGQRAQVKPVPEAPQWPDQTTEDMYIPEEEFDSSDLSVINRELNRCRARLFRVSHSMKDAQRKLREAELLYSRHMRRALVQVSGGTAETRKAVAEMECEPFENDMVVKQQVVEELRKRAQDVRDDLKAVENLSHNARAQMNIQ